MTDEKYPSYLSYMDRNEPQNLDNWLCYEVTPQLFAKHLRTRSLSGALGMLRSMIEHVGKREYIDEESDRRKNIYDILRMIIAEDGNK